jgi:hypothetical protein
VIRICAALAEHPVTSFSVACGDGLRQAAHRIFAHASTSIERLLSGHFQQTQQRSLQHCLGEPGARLLVVQDTTVLDYTSHWATQDLGPIGNEVEQRGLLAHAALALPVEGPPLGVAHLSIWARDPAQHGSSRAGNPAQKRPSAEKESRKWLEGLRGVESALGTEVPFLLIQDREGDVFDFMAAPRQPNAELLVRASQPRKVLLQEPALQQIGRHQRPETPSLWETLADAPVCGSFRLAVPRAPGRKAREAEMELRVVEVWIVPPRTRLVTEETKQRRAVRVWAVQAQEINAPSGAEPLCWTLLSTLPVEDAAMAQHLVHCYSRRWLIEQLHMVLKSGLRIERLQFDDAASLKHAIALCYVVAWRVIYARDIARFAPDAPAEEVVSPLERQVLEMVEKRPLPTVRQAVRAVAHLAGFPRYPSAGEPGVKSLWEGLRRLEAMLDGWALAMEYRDTRQD